MKRIIKLTESDLKRLVKRVIKEQELDKELSRAPKGILGHNDYWYDEQDRPVNPDEFDYDEEIEFGPDDFEDYISHTETDFPGNRWSFNVKGFKGDREHGKGYWDRYQKQGPIKLRKKFVKEQDDNTLDEPHYQFDRESGMVLLRGAHSRQVKKILSNLPTNLTWLAIADCEFADFDGVDLCSFPDLKNVNLVGTENNLDEQGFECLNKWDERGQYSTW